MRNSLWESTSLLLVLFLSTHSDQHLLTTTLRNVDHLPKKVQAFEKSTEFVCKEPQPRAYNLRDMMEGVLQNTAETPLDPVYIIFKRCDIYTGCCPSTDLSCTPVQSSLYKQELEITIWSLDTNETRKMWIRIEHHGECECNVTSFSDRICQENQKPFLEVLLPLSYPEKSEKSATSDLKKDLQT